MLFGAHSVSRMMKMNPASEELTSTIFIDITDVMGLPGSVLNLVKMAVSSD